MSGEGSIYSIFNDVFWSYSSLTCCEAIKILLQRQDVGLTLVDVQHPSSSKHMTETASEEMKN
jgi:hypothetical protein